MDPWTLACLAGHRYMNITKRHVHEQEQTVHVAMDRRKRQTAGILLGIQSKA